MSLKAGHVQPRARPPSAGAPRPEGRPGARSRRPCRPTRRRAPSATRLRAHLLEEARVRRPVRRGDAPGPRPRARPRCAAARSASRTRASSGVNRTACAARATVSPDTRARPSRASRSRTASNTPSGARANARRRSSSRGMPASRRRAPWKSRSRASAPSAEGGQHGRPPPASPDRGRTPRRRRAPAGPRAARAAGTVTRAASVAASRPAGPASSTMRHGGRREVRGARDGRPAPPPPLRRRADRPPPRPRWSPRANTSGGPADRRGRPPPATPGGAGRAPSLPAPPASPSSVRTRARTSALAMWTRTRASSFRGRSDGRSVSSASTMEVARSVPGRVTTSPRAMSCTSRPPRLTAVRWPASTRSAGAPWTCRPRTRARRPPGSTSISSPTASVPETSVPVTTVPNPRMVKARSTGRRSSPSAGRRRGLAGQGPQRVLQRVEPLARPRRHAQHGRAFEERAGHELADLHLRQGLHVRVGGVALGERHQAARDAEEPADVEVLARLGHDRLVRGHHQHHRVDAVGAGQHVAHEALVAGHVDEGGDEAVAEVQVGEAQVDGDPAFLLFLEAVRIDAGQRPDEGALAVIDVARGADDQRAHGPLTQRPRGRITPRAWSRRRRPRRSCAAWRPGPGGPPSPCGR